MNEGMVLLHFRERRAFVKITSVIIDNIPSHLIFHSHLSTGTRRSVITLFVDTVKASVLLWTGSALCIFVANSETRRFASACYKGNLELLSNRDISSLYPLHKIY